jgi:uncharacterized protein YciI
MKFLPRSLVAAALILGFSPAALPAADPTPSAPTKAAVPMEFDNFFIVLLVRPENPPEQPKEELERIQAAHLDNIRRLHAEKKIAFAGPFEDFSGRNVRGMFILRTASLEEAKSWVETDPAVKAGRLKPEYLKWFVEKGALK